MIALNDIDVRSREIFRRLVETYLSTGEPVGSRTLSHDTGIAVSAATIRNVMADLTDLGLLHAPHVSAGRLPTELGLRLFVDGLMQVGDLSPEERRAIETESNETNSAETLLEAAASRLSGLTQTASLIVTQKSDSPMRQIEFVKTSPGQALVIMVFEDGRVENRIIDAPDDLPPSALIAAGNYLNARLRGRSLSETRTHIIDEVESNRAELDELTARLVRDGVARLSGDDNWTMVVRGRGHLLDETAQDIERVRMLLDDLEKKREVIELLTAARDGEGVKVFIGSENRLFSLSGSSVITAPYRDEKRQIVGVLGVIGPTRLNYARVVPIVDYTAEVLSRMLK
ncbi:heat-inducible transcriptional repressor HrcA [Hyphococcus sp.]|uniref:heat-inducible transcriptional repressor HrcA n=1 Tax=Hyphococcus sp. TaxID=2038636 RepID=UPI003CCC1E59